MIKNDCLLYATVDNKPSTPMEVCFAFLYCGEIVFTPSSFQASSGLTQSWQGSATQAALCPTVSAMATRGNRSGSLQDGAIVPSDLLTSQKGTPLLVHPMLHPNIGSPRDTATLGGYRLCLPCHPCFATTISVFVFGSHIYPAWGGPHGFYPQDFFQCGQAPRLSLLVPLDLPLPLYGCGFNILTGRAAAAVSVQVKYKNKRF